MRVHIIFLLAIMAFGLMASEARAADPAHGASCSGFTAGASACNANGCFTCTSGNWVDQPLYIGTSAATCGSTYEGQQRYNSTNKVIETCNSSGWLGGEYIQQSTNVTTCSSSYKGMLRYLAGSPDTIQYCNGTSWQTFGSLYCDGLTNVYFPSLTSQTQSTTVTSTIDKVITTSCTSMPISISGTGTPQYQICSDSACATVDTAWTSSAGTIAANKYVQLRVTNSNNGNTAVTASLKIASTTLTWSSTTLNFKYIFITSLTYAGNLKGAAANGLAGANANCAARATAASLPGTYYAWLATTTASGFAPATEFQQNLGPYELLDVGHTVVATSWSDLIDGTIAHAINVTESGGSVSSTNNVWTNVTKAGARIGATNCTNFTVSTAGTSGAVGSSSSATATWTNAASTATCNSTLSLYCVQQ